jgi:hypothetical protein
LFAHTFAERALGLGVLGGGAGFACHFAGRFIYYM